MIFPLLGREEASMRYWGKRLAAAALVVGLLGGTAVWAQQAPGTKAAGPAGTRAASPAGTRVTTELININTADAATLEVLPGIGPVKAKAVIEYREKNGPFKMVDDLKNVSGIGDKTLQDLRDKVTVGEE
jgi:competence protein ComEA